MSYFTYLWTNECRANMLQMGCTGQPLNVAAGSVFTKRGVRRGDKVYVLSVHDGDVFLIGRMRIVSVLAREQYDATHDNPNLWPGDEVILGEDGTPMRFDFKIPGDVLKGLKFDSQGTPKGLIVEDGKLIEAQSLRSVRQLWWESVADLDSLLEPE